MRTTVDEALAEFELIPGIGSEADKKACAMTLLAWLDECDEWTDHPKCAHPLIADQVIKANDANGTTAEMRGELVKLGTTGVLDTWWVPTEVIVGAVAGKRGAAVPSQYDRTVRMLGRVTAWKDDRVRPNLAGADLTGANLTGANLTGADLTGADLTGANLTGADLSGAYLSGAYLYGAYLTGADLTRADLTVADLTRADLTGAIIYTGWKITRA